MEFLEKLKFISNAKINKNDLFIQFFLKINKFFKAVFKKRKVVRFLMITVWKNLTFCMLFP